MKFHLARPALVLASSLALASCGGSGKETFPVKVTVTNLLYPGLILTTNGQELAVPVAAKAGDTVVATFPNALDYGTYYNVIPKGGTASDRLGAQPKHQTCVTNGIPREYGTAGQTASLESARTPAIEVGYTCAVNTIALGGTVSGATTGTITLINGSNSQTTIDLAAATTFTLSPVAYGTSYGVTVLTAPAGYTCTVPNGAGVMLDAQEALAAGVSVTVTCVAKPT